MDLTQTKPGKKVKVIQIQSGQNLIQRLYNLGIYPGIEIIKISGQFFKGPITIEVGSAQIAVGYGMAKRIMVEPIK